MTEINWNLFKAKFNGKEQKTFEWLSYLLFCDEFNIPQGIFRFKNQAGIETEPIKINNESIGFQAKFYDTKISDNTVDIKDSIEKAKRKNPDINKILFYINKEFSESTKKEEKDPKYKTEIENCAKSLSIKIEWKVPSHFERQLAIPKNQNLAQYCFDINKSVFDFIEKLKAETELILSTIHSEIKVNGKEIKIYRDDIIESIKNMQNEFPLILTGEAGVGKSALIKDTYNLLKETTPFFVFRATKFNLSSINDIFHNHGNFTLSDFMNEFKDVNEKYIVIDSAEKLSDMQHQEVFKDFLSAFHNDNWNIIFTVRHNYLSDIEYKLINFYHSKFKTLNIGNITKECLIDFSKEYKFNLPDNKRLFELLQIPFYLNEYFQIYRNFDNIISLSDFKKKLWNIRIANTAFTRNRIHIRREECFLKIAEKIANDGHYIINANGCDDEALQGLINDEIIEYDSNVGGYFIVHDIYEEWALDKIIERSLLSSEDYKIFFQNIGSSLSIRRAFRNWLSEKLINNKDKAKSLIKLAIIDSAIESCWKDEIYISVMLSDYAKVFFQLFENELMCNNQKQLMRIIFLLRIACKETDEDSINSIGINYNDILKIIFVKPKGTGWHIAIDFINEHIKVFDLENINSIISLLDDWNCKNKTGETTKKASKIALYYYEEITKNKSFSCSTYNDLKNKLIRVILNGVSEIKEELKRIINEVICLKQTNSNDKYYGIIQTILTSITDSIEVVKYLPEYVIKLAELFWFQSSEEKFGYTGMSIDEYFCVLTRHYDYYPSSAFQTPIFQLLKVAQKPTIEFIISFTNKTVECYSKSELKNEVEEVEIFINEKEMIKQYASNRLWSMYRGTQVSPHLLESIHMALEKWLLEYTETAPQEELEDICKYLIKESKSASITAVVTSAVLAYPDKFFKISEILFRTKEFFIYDIQRAVSEQTPQEMVSSPSGYPHRKRSLEDIALYYQLNSEEKQKKIIWAIIDIYYKDLINKVSDTNADKHWRLCLARIDSRKMDYELNNYDKQFYIKLKPKVDPDLRKYSEESLLEISNKTRYIPLKIWSESKFKKDESFKRYDQYDNNIQLVIKETKKIMVESPPIFGISTIAYTCSVLIRDYPDKLNQDDIDFCKNVIIKFASIPIIHVPYFYQISDGTEPSIAVLPLLINFFPKEKETVKVLLFLLMVNVCKEISEFAVTSIFYNLWDISFEDANSIFLGYLLLKTQYYDLENTIRKQNHSNNISEFSREQIDILFIEKHGDILDKVVSNDISYDVLGNLGSIDTETLAMAFSLLPLGTKNTDHKEFINDFFPVFSKKLFVDNDSADYHLIGLFLRKFARFILTSTSEENDIYLKSFVENFSDSNNMSYFFQELILAEDELNQYEEFWIVWDVFYDKVVKLCKNRNINFSKNTKEILRIYLLALFPDNLKEWHTLKEREKLFFKKIAEDLGHYPTVFYLISKVLNNIGSNFIEDSIVWISDILQRSNNLGSEELEDGTIYYIEKIIIKYVSTNRQEIKRSLKIKNQVIIILNFLIEKGSIKGYFLREDIL